jgi:hypothetical protein
MKRLVNLGFLKYTLSNFFVKLSCGFFNDQMGVKVSNDFFFYILSFLKGLELNSL